MEFILGFVALLNAAVELIGASWAVKSEGIAEKIEIKPVESPCFKDAEAEKQMLLYQAEQEEKRRKTELNRKKPVIYKRSDVVASESKQERKNDPIAEWVFRHDEIIIKCLEPGRHMIPNKELGGISKDKLADFLFRQQKIESVDIVTNGLEVTTRS